MKQHQCKDVLCALFDARLDDRVLRPPKGRAVQWIKTLSDKLTSEALSAVSRQEVLQRNPYKPGGNRDGQRVLALRARIQQTASRAVSAVSSANLATS